MYVFHLVTFGFLSHHLCRKGLLTRFIICLVNKLKLVLGKGGFLAGAWWGLALPVLHI